MATHKIWLLKMILPFPRGRLLTGILLLSILLPSFYLGVGEDPSASTPALFFSLIIAYIIPVFSFITAKSQEALSDLQPILAMDELEIEAANRRLDSASGRTIFLQLGAGALLGFAHLSYVRGSAVETVTVMVSSLTGFMSSLGALLVWVTMTAVLSMLIQQAILFARLGANRVQVSLLNTRSLLPFARVSIISSLAIIGALALFPLMSIESGMDLAESLPGAIATLAPLIALFVVPVWPVHRRLVAAKEQELTAVNQQIDACQDNSGRVDLNPGKLAELTPLLSYRREIAQVSTWPFDAGVVTRLTLYLIIPPLTWAGAALIENVVDSFL